MAILKSSVKLIIRELPRYSYSGPALALGVPEVYATHAELREWLPALAGRSYDLAASELAITDNVVGRKLGWVTAQTFFHALGISKVTSVDIPGCEHPADIIHDLNTPLPAEFADRFRFILDPGTIEHVFDIKTVLSGIVRSLAVGGTVIHQVPVYSYNGGYYSINPNVLNDFYTANGFDTLKSFIIMWDRYRAYTGRHRCYEYSEAELGDRHALADYDQCRFSPHMLFLARKVRVVAETVMPIQFSGQYITRGAVPPQTALDVSIARRLVRGAHRALRWGLPFAVYFYLDARVRREWQLHKIRRHSFWI